MRFLIGLSLTFFYPYLPQEYVCAFPMNVRVDRKVMSALSSSLKEEDSSSTAEKRIVFIRHGCTYMNEHLATPGCGWGDPNFSDVFPDEHEREMKYRDSPLSPKGVEQAKTLAKQLGDLVNGEPEAHLELSLSFEERNILKELDLVVVSPLTRAIQTFEIGLWPHIQSRCTNPSELSVVAHPFAAERVYLISDHGKKHPMLQDAYGHLVDFEIGFQHMEDKEAAWWFSLDDKNIVFDSKSGTSYEHEDYEEWRPVGEGQTYACAGKMVDCKMFLCFS